MFKETKNGKTNFCPQCENYARKLEKVREWIFIQKEKYECGDDLDDLEQIILINKKQ
jgi:hypothetical protein